MDRRNKYPVPIQDCPGVYCIRNVVTGQEYIGQSLVCGMRRSSHFSALRRGKHSNSLLQASYARYGFDAFVFEIIQKTPRNLAARLIAEQKQIDRRKPIFNRLMVSLPYALRSKR